MTTDGSTPSRVPGAVQPRADVRGGPSLFEGVGYQSGVALMEIMVLLATRQQAPLAVLALRCEHRQLVPDGQFGYDIGVVTPQGTRSVEMKSAPTRAEVLELLARLPSVAEDGGATIQLVHGKANDWTRALERLLAYAAEASDDEALRRLVESSGNDARSTLLAATPVHPQGPRALLASMETPQFLPPAAVERVVHMQARLLAGDRAAELVAALTVELLSASRTRRTIAIGELHEQLVDAGLVSRVALVTPSTDPTLLRAVGILDACPSPVPEALMAQVLGLSPGGVRMLLGELIGAQMIYDDGSTLWRPPSADPIPREAIGSSLRDMLAALVEDPPAASLERIAQVSNVLALANACRRDDPWLVAQAFYPYDKASKATGDLSTVYLLARVALDAGSRVPRGSTDRDDRLLWLRGHARICGSSWTLQRVEELDAAAAEMDAARRDATQFEHLDNLAFVEKCQGRLSRLRAEELAAVGDHRGATQWYEVSRAQLAAAERRFLGLASDQRFVGKYGEEPGECLALLARTALSQQYLGEAENFAEQAHAQLDGLGPRCKPWADTCLVDAEIALAHVRSGMSADGARIALSAQTEQLQKVLSEFRDVADEIAQVDVSANEIVARTLQVLALLAQEIGDPDRAAELFELAGRYFHHVDQSRAAYRCQARALELQQEIPAALLAALSMADADPGCQVEATRLHLADPREQAPTHYWAGLVQRGKVAAAAREHRWSDRAGVAV